MSNKEKCLVINALGEDQPGIINALSQLVMESGGNIVDSRMSVLGSAFAIIVLVTGPADCIEHILKGLPELERRLQLTIVTRRSSQPSPRPQHIPYRVKAIAIDNPGIVYRLTQFFSNREINILSCETERFAAAHTGTPMFSLAMQVDIPASRGIAELREAFLDLCDELNIDAALEIADK